MKTPAADLRLVGVEAGLHIVESSSKGETRRYRVDLNRLRCDCEAGRRGTLCRHLRWVHEQLADRDAR